MKSVFDKAAYRYQLRKNIFGIPGLFFSDLKCCFQRIRHGYCYKDLWSIDEWFLSIMPDMLQEYKDSRNGSPGCLGENYTDENGILRNDTCHEEWDRILDRMIFLLREAEKDTCSRKNPLEEECGRIRRFIITLKKNLPEEDLRRFFEEAGKLAQFSKEGSALITRSRQRS